GPGGETVAGALELQALGLAGEGIGLEASGDFLGEAPKPQLERAEVGDVVVEGGFRRNALGLALGPDRPIVETAGEVSESGALGAVAPPQVDLAGALQISDGAQAVAGEALLRHLADAEDQRHRLRRQESGGLVAAEDRKAARLVEIGGDLGEKLVAGEPDRHGDAERGLDLAGETRERLGG